MIVPPADRPGCPAPVPRPGQSRYVPPRGACDCHFHVFGSHDCKFACNNGSDLIFMMEEAPRKRGVEVTAFATPEGVEAETTDLIPDTSRPSRAVKRWRIRFRKVRRRAVLPSADRAR